jgi:hypothetical protein
MDSRLELHRTLGLAMGTLNTCLLMLIIVVVAQIRGELAGLFGGLSTLLGLALFALLWGTTSYCTYRGWVETAPSGNMGRIGSRYFGPSVVWGSISGVLFFGSLLVVYLVVSVSISLATGNPAAIPVIFIFGLFAMVFGCLVACVVGMTLGVAFATIDVLLAKLVLAMLRPAPAP